MKKISLFLILIILSILISGFTIRKTDFRKGIKNNVCKDLSGKVLVYTIFVDTKTTSPWSEYDIKSTLDSIRVATRWIQQKAIDNNIKIQFTTDYYVGPEYTTIKKNLPEESIFLSVTKPNKKQGITNINKWSDYIARKAGDSFNITDKDGLPTIKKPKNKERLIALLRDQYDVESVVLLFMMNNYYKTDISIQLNTMHTKEIEYAIVSYKYPSEIAHNILHLFGAADLNETLYRKNTKSINFANNELPNEIMQDPFGKNINDLIISDYNKYLIGWDTGLTKEFEFLLYDKSRF